MKVTIYELLGLIREGKAPRSILFKGDVWFWGYNTYTTFGCLDNTPDAQYSMFSKYRIDYCLNDEVEIIEEENTKELEEIEKLKLSQFFNKQKKLATKINELIDKVNSLSNKE